MAEDSKLAALVADRIVNDIAEMGWPEGEVVGSETELQARYGVSRAVFREAVRLVEHRQVAWMRRGPGGGLIVAASTGESVIDAVVVYLSYVGVRLDELFEARLVLEASVAELAPERLTEEDIVALRDLAERERAGTVADPRELHALVAHITKNPALEFFVHALNRLTYMFIPDASGIGAKQGREVIHAHGAIVEAVLGGNEGLTRHRMARHLEAEGDYLSRRVSGSIDLTAIAALDRSEKRAQSVAWAILGEIAAAGWPVGSVIGSESDLMEHHDCSRAVLREAVRLLEYHEIALMRRGVGGGLLVTEPGIEAATQAVALHLERQGITPEQLFEVRSAIEMAIVELVVERLTDERAERLRQAIEMERAASDEEFAIVGHDLHDVLAAECDNRVLELLSLVLVRLTRLRQMVPKGGDPKGSSSAVLKAHDGLVLAILEGDLELSRHRMRAHLDALSAWVR